MVSIELYCSNIDDAIESIKKLQKEVYGELSVVVKIINPSNLEA